MTNNDKTVIKYCEVIIGICFLIVGCAVYLLFRSRTLNIYHWCDMLGFATIIDRLRLVVQDWHISDFVKYSLPDGLYCAAYILMMDSIWQKESGLMKYAVIFFIPLFTISSEIFQYFGWIKGTFDINDLLCYSIPPLIYILYNYNSLKFNNLKIKTL